MGYLVMNEKRLVCFDVIYAVRLVLVGGDKISR